MQQTKLTRAYGSRPLLRPAVQRVPRLAVSASAAVNPSVVVFKMQHHVNYGDSMHLTGSHEAIGSWDPKAALAMSWTEGDVWVAEAKVPVG